jgi:hypothetical protein
MNLLVPDFIAVLTFFISLNKLKWGSFCRVLSIAWHAWWAVVWKYLWALLYSIWSAKDPKIHSLTHLWRFAFGMGLQTSFTFLRRLMSRMLKIVMAFGLKAFNCVKFLIWCFLLKVCSSGFLVFVIWKALWNHKLVKRNFAQ